MRKKGSEWDPDTDPDVLRVREALRRERAARGLPPTITDPQVYQEWARILRPVVEQLVEERERRPRRRAGRGAKGVIEKES